MSHRSFFVGSLLVCAVCLSGVFSAYADSGIAVFPPTNEAAGGGLLYFPEGGNASLFAVPVLADQNILNKLDEMIAAIKADTEAKKKEAWQCVSLPTGVISVSCFNPQTGMFCSTSYSSGASFVCNVFPGWPG